MERITKGVLNTLIEYLSTSSIVPTFCTETCIKFTPNNLSTSLFLCSFFFFFFFLLYSSLCSYLYSGFFTEVLRALLFPDYSGYCSGISRTYRHILVPSLWFERRSFIINVKSSMLTSSTFLIVMIPQLLI